MLSSMTVFRNTSLHYYRMDPSSFQAPAVVAVILVDTLWKKSHKKGPKQSLSSPG